MRKRLIFCLVLVSVFRIFAVGVEDLEKAAMFNNASIRTASQNVDKALLDVQSARVGMMPSVDLTVTGSYLCNPIEPIRINLGDYVDFRTDYVTLYQGQEKTYYQFSLSATQPVYTWGKLKNSVSLYEEIYKVAQIQLEDCIDKAYTEIRTRYAVLYYLNKIEALLNEQQSISDRLVELSQVAFQNGLMIETDFLGIKVKANQINVAKAQVHQQILQMETALKGLTGVVVSADDLEFNETQLLSVVNDFNACGYTYLLDKATSENRNNFKILNKLKDISDLSENISSASRNWIPDFALVVSANYQGPRLPGIEKDWYGKDDWDATVTLALKTTLFDGGKAKNNYLKTQNDSTQAEINIDDAIVQVSSALTESFTNMDVCNTKIEYQKALSEQLSAKVKVQQELLDSGYGSESNLLETMLDANNSEIDSLQTKINLVSSVYSICYLSDY